MQALRKSLFAFPWKKEVFLTRINLTELDCSLGRSFTFYHRHMRGWKIFHYQQILVNIVKPLIKLLKYIYWVSTTCKYDFQSRHLSIDVKWATKEVLNFDRLKILKWQEKFSVAAAASRSAPFISREQVKRWRSRTQTPAVTNDGVREWLYVFERTHSGTSQWYLCKAVYSNTSFKRCQCQC